MAERKAVNKYYPPDWDPRKGSVNKRVGQHPLRDRARKLGQGILVIRFELPYNIWCGGCGSHVGMGVRYNAEKSKVGNYYSTPIYKFRMKCHLCDNYFEIQTDPKNHDYVILSGARRKEQRWDPVANEQVVPEDKATQKKLATDPMYKLEHGSNDQQKGKEKVMSLAQIEDSRVSMKDDYILNRMARDKFRAEKKQLREAAEADRAIVEKAALDIELVEESEEDRKLAGLMKYSVTSTFEDKQMERRKSIEQRPIFDTGGPASFPSSTPLSSSSSSPGNPQHHKLSLSSPSSKHGDLKQKLGRVLQASYKDPFTSGVVKQKHTAIPFSSQRPSQLGIKLKSAVKPKSGKHAGVAKTTDNKNHLSKTSSKINQPSVRSLSPARTVDDNSSSTSVPSNNNTEAPPSSSASSRPKTCNQISNISSASVQSPSSTDSPVCASANGSVQESTNAESKSLSCDITDKVSEKILCVSQGELESREPSETNSDLTLGSSENSGLLTLISSYGDSDSDSNP